jgi:hypothetical protein
MGSRRSPAHVQVAPFITVQYQVPTVIHRISGVINYYSTTSMVMGHLWLLLSTRSPPSIPVTFLYCADANLTFRDASILHVIPNNGNMKQKRFKAA